MPEYPEVKVYAKNLTALLSGKTVTASWGAPFDCAGKTLERVDSHGKKLLLVYADKSAFAVHLMLAGEFSYLPVKDISQKEDVKLRLDFGDRALLVVDPSGYAKIGGLLDTAVPEPVADQLGLEYFRKVLQCRKTIKAVLTDQKLVSGIGNAYADEILYRAGVHPASIARAIPNEVAETLYQAVLDVIAYAVDTFDRQAEGAIAGESRDRLEVHVPGKKTTTKGETIETIEIGGRKSYVASSQRLYA